MRRYGENSWEIWAEKVCESRKGSSKSASCLIKAISLVTYELEEELLVRFKRGTAVESFLTTLT